MGCMGTNLWDSILGVAHDIGDLMMRRGDLYLRRGRVGAYLAPLLAPLRVASTGALSFPRGRMACLLRSCTSFSATWGFGDYSLWDLPISVYLGLNETGKDEERTLFVIVPTDGANDGFIGTRSTVNRVQEYRTSVGK